MAFDEWARAIVLAVARETENWYGNPDLAGRRDSLEQIRNLVEIGRNGLVEQPEPANADEIRRRVDFRRAIRRLGDYVGARIETFDADPSIGELLARAQPLVSLWDEDYRDPAFTDES